jgi:hypothetical protein
VSLTIGFAGNAVSVAIHAFTISGIAAIQRVFAVRANFVATGIIDGSFNLLGRRGIGGRLYTPRTVNTTKGAAVFRNESLAMEGLSHGFG